MPGAATSEVEISIVSTKGFWIYVRGRELFVDFDTFPWFKRARVEEILDLEVHGEDHLHWPKLDVDLTIERIEHPERFPLVARIDPAEEGGGRNRTAG